MSEEPVKNALGINLKDIVSNVAALLLIVGEAINQYMIQLNDGEISWGRLSLVAMLAFLGWINGKKANLKDE